MGGLGTGNGMGGGVAHARTHARTRPLNSLLAGHGGASSAAMSFSIALAGLEGRKAISLSLAAQSRREGIVPFSPQRIAKLGLQSLASLPSLLRLGDSGASASQLLGEAFRRIACALLLQNSIL